MATWTIYTAKANLANSSNPATIETTPVSTGVTFDDANVNRPGLQTIQEFLNFLQKDDHRGLSYMATTTGGAPFTRAGDQGGLTGGALAI